MCLLDYAARDLFLAGEMKLLCRSRGGVRGADMRRELLVAPLFVVKLHLLQRLPNGWTRRVELPGAFGASPAVKILSLDPYQLAAPLLHCTSPDLVRLSLHEG